MGFLTKDILLEAGRKWPDKTAVYSASEIIRYKDLCEVALALSELLAGIIPEKGTGMALLTGNNSQFISGIFACSLAGAVVMPVPKSLLASEIEAELVVASLNLLLIEKNLSPEFKQAHDRTGLNEKFDIIHFTGINPISITERFPGAAFIRPSSGTTGRSKGVVISHQAVFERIEAANQGLCITANDNILWPLPMAFHFIVSVFLYIRYGAGLILADDFLPETMIELSNKHKATILYASPLHYRLLASLKNSQRFKTLKTAICTSAGIDVNVTQKFHAKFDIPVSQAFGIIEIGLPLINTNKPIEKTESTGQALPSYQVRIFDDDMNPVPENTPGILGIKGPGMFSGYLWPLQRAESVMKNSWFLTGDIARIDGDGFVFILGRKKSVINVAGNKIFPEEVENILRLHPDISEVRVYRGFHNITGEIVEAEIVLKENVQENLPEIISYCKQHLSSIKIPQRILFVKEIQKTKTGKIIRF